MRQGNDLTNATQGDNGMTIEEMVKRKSLMDDAIHNAIKGFTEETGMTVQSVYLNTDKLWINGKPMEILYRVETQVTL